MHVVTVLSILLFTTNVLANKTDSDNIEEIPTQTDKPKFQELDAVAVPKILTQTDKPKFQELDAVVAVPSITDDDNESKEEIKRAKKSTTTTFCVEIRPSGPFQKPFQVCEPVEPAKQPIPSQAYSLPSAPAYYSGPSYGTPEQPKPEPAYAPAPAAYKPSQPKSGAVYSAPMKTFVAPTTPKPYPAHGMSYSSYNAKGEEISDDHGGHLMKMSHGSGEQEDHHHDTQMLGDQHLQSTSYGYSSPSYGAASYVPMVPKKHLKHPNHNGLVITCQPNLAGYAHNVPSSLHHPPAVSHYSYRSSTPSKIGRYQAQSQAYGSYQQPQYKSAVNSYNKPQQAAHQSAPPVQVPMQQFASAYSSASYLPVEPSYAAPVYKSPPPAPVYSRSQAPPSYGPPPPTPAYTPPTAPAPPPAPAYAQYSQSLAPEPAPASFAPPAKPYSSPALPAPAPPQQAPAYAPPGTYLTAEEDNRIQASSPGASTTQDDKEKHTLKKMEEVAQQQAAATQWAAEVSPDKPKEGSKSEHVGNSQGWSTQARVAEDDDNLRKTAENQKEENEIK